MKREDVTLDKIYIIGISCLVGLSSRYCEKTLPVLDKHDYREIWNKANEIGGPWLDAGDTSKGFPGYFNYEAVSMITAATIIRDEKFYNYNRERITFDDFCKVIEHLIAVFEKFSPCNGQPLHLADELTLH